MFLKSKKYLIIGIFLAIFLLEGLIIRNLEYFLWYLSFSFIAFILAKIFLLVKIKYAQKGIDYAASIIFTKDSFGNYAIEAMYDKKLNKITVLLKQKDAVIKKQEFSGLEIIKLVTSKGIIGYEF